MLLQLKAFLIGCCFCLLAGCSFHSTQLEFVRSFFNKEEVQPDNYWVLKLPDQVVPLIAISDVELYTSFANSSLSINFYALSLSSAYGWPEVQADITIAYENSRLFHRLGDEQIEMQCAEWVQGENLKWQSDCDSASGVDWSYRNEIQFDENGRIIGMRYWLWPGLSPIELIWFPVSGENLSLFTDTSL